MMSTLDSESTGLSVRPDLAFCVLGLNPLLSPSVSLHSDCIGPRCTNWCSFFISRILGWRVGGGVDIFIIENDEVGGAEIL